MQVCGLSRILLPAMFAGIVVSTFSQSEALGWAAALVVGIAALTHQRFTGRGARCAVPAVDRGAARAIPEAAPVEPPATSATHATVGATTASAARTEQPVGVTR